MLSYLSITNKTVVNVTIKKISLLILKISIPKEKVNLVSNYLLKIHNLLWTYI